MPKENDHANHKKSKNNLGCSHYPAANFQLSAVDTADSSPIAANFIDSQAQAPATEI